ncbi:diguanylate cyclase [Acidovorax citrulli]|nr:diguanylate cyclase [Paracidovorax citrulli]
MAMEAEERLLLQARTQERAREYRRLIIGATLGGAAFIIFLVWSVTYAAALFRRSTTRIETLSESADCDPLTGLLNRRALEERFTSLAGYPLTVVAFDLDDFKPVNDTYGHQAGDEVLMVTAKRMLRECRDGDLVARVGGDEFVVVLSGVSDADTARSVCTRLQHVLCEPIQLHTAAVRVGGFPGLRSLSRRHRLERLACQSRCGSLCSEISPQVKKTCATWEP